MLCGVMGCWAGKRDVTSTPSVTINSQVCRFLARKVKPMSQVGASKIIAVSFLTACVAVARAYDFKPPAVGSKYHFKSTTSGDLVVEVVGADDISYTTKTTRERGDNTDEYRPYGIHFFAKQYGEGILPADLRKLSQLFPLRIGNNVSHEVYGGPTTARWWRTNKLEVVRRYVADVGDNKHEMYTIKISHESNYWWKLDGLCEYSTVYSICVRFAGEGVFARNAPVQKFETNMKKAVVGGVETILPDWQTVPK